MGKQFEADELVYRGRITEVHKVALRMGDGKLVWHDFVHYPGGVVVLPVLADGSIVLIRNWRFAVEERLWELPAGMLEEGEPPSACAARELTEETGYVAGRIVPLGSFYVAPGTTDDVLHAFLADDLKHGRQDLEDYEDIRVEVLPEPAVRDRIRDGTIHDAKTLATLTLYWLSQGAF